VVPAELLQRLSAPPSHVRLAFVPPPFDAFHLVGVGVVVLERRVDVRDVYVEPFGDLRGGLPGALDESPDPADGDTAALDVWFVVELRDDPAGGLCQGRPLPTGS
jgi:hypothetical protein